MTFADERAVAIEAVILASRMCQRVQADLQSADTLDKADGSPVTVADFAAQGIVGHFLKSRFPDVPMIAEEDVATLDAAENAGLKANVLAQVREFLPALSDGEILVGIAHGDSRTEPPARYWTLDPIDGTKGFVRGAQYAVCLALVENGRVALSVLGCPNQPADISEMAGKRGFLAVAVRGEGAVMRPDFDSPEEVQIHADGIADTRAAILADSVDTRHAAIDRAGEALASIGLDSRAIRMDGQGKYALVAMGQASAFIRLPRESRRGENVWDHASGVLLVEEAGGRVTDVNGQPLDFTRRRLDANHGIVATNGKIHAAVLDALAAFRR